MYYVQDSRSGNAVLWWAINGAGYVTEGKLINTKSEIISDFGEGRETDIVWPAGHVESAVRVCSIQGNRKKCETFFNLILQLSNYE